MSSNRWTPSYGSSSTTPRKATYPRKRPPSLDITAQMIHWIYDLTTNPQDKVWYDLACNELDPLSNPPGLGPDIIRLPRASLPNDETLTFWKRNVQA